MDFETSAPKESGVAPEDDSSFAISYVNVFAFHLTLNLQRVVIERSFGHSLEELTSLSDLTKEQLLYDDRETCI